ncbi:MAG: leucine-rich repeat protein, partial [Clostridia bacterium]|nr:leucine-rich repeat protein [Clostridia bacterium]
ATFRDVDSSDWFAKNVQTAYELGLMQGKGTSRFDPDAGITIAEAIAVAARLHAIYTHGTDEMIPVGNPWYEPYLQYANDAGIVLSSFEGYISESYDNGVWSTKVTDSASRRLFAGILAKALPDDALSAINDISDDAIPDVGHGSHYGAEVYKLYRAGILSGSDAYGRFNPETPIARREVAAILARMVDPAQRVQVKLKEADFVVTGYCGGDYTLSAGDGYLAFDGGENVSYSLDLATGELVISGKGPMGLFQIWSGYANRIKTAVIEPGVTSVGNEAFLNCINLEKVTLPDTITSLYTSAFKGCTKLEQITLPNTITSIGWHCFEGCTSLKSIRIPDGVTAFGRSVFFDCTSLESVENTAQIKGYDWYCFGNCVKLTSIEIAPDARMGVKPFANCPAGNAIGQ